MVRNYQPKLLTKNGNLALCTCKQEQSPTMWMFLVSGGTTARHGDQMVKTPKGMHLEQPDKRDKLQDDENVQTEAVRASVLEQMLKKIKHIQEWCRTYRPWY